MMLGVAEETWAKKAVCAWETAKNVMERRKTLAAQNTKKREKQQNVSLQRFGFPFFRCFCVFYMPIQHTS